MKLRPLNDGIVIKQLEAKDKTAGGIILPDSAKEKPQIGKVISVGPGRTLDNGKVVPLELKKGDKVYYSKYMGNEVEVKGDKYVIIKEKDVLAIIED